MVGAGQRIEGLLDATRRAVHLISVCWVSSPTGLLSKRWGYSPGRSWLISRLKGAQKQWHRAVQATLLRYTAVGSFPLCLGPDFTLHATPDQTITLSDLLGRPVILGFYPADWSPVCGDQMALYNEILPEFRKFGRLLGVP